MELILAALLAGAGAGASTVVSSTIQDAYKGALSILQNRLARHGRAQAIEAGGVGSTEWRTALCAALEETGVAADEEVLIAMQDLLEAVEMGKAEHFDLRDAKGVQIGHSNTQHNTFS
ncbi:hypothetical protein [Streptomyces virginiae]|uniref:hypothetical protein n=1 Tax=Streptomyces virginiae TaxID=1961 RepID=UPI0022518728|nr:hypothetical protein [Streptomyces virginiae]MCX5174692.1 hypothetical protein [Streptomyces virginiae]